MGVMLLQIIKRRWRFALSSLILIIYLLSVIFAAEKDGDFVHLWVGARTITSGQPAALYDPDLHYDILDRSHVDAAEFWGPRYDIIGVFFYPPLAGLLYAPVSWLPLFEAQFVTGILNILAGIWSAWMLWRILEGRFSLPSILIILFTFPSFFYSFVLGQNGILTMALMLTGWELIRQKKDTAAGLALSWLSYKPNWLLAIGWFPLVERRWRMIGGLALGGLIVTGLTAAIVGIQPFIDYLDVLSKTAALHNLPEYPLNSQYSILSIFRRYFGIGRSADLLGWGSVLLLFGGTVWLLGFRLKQAPSTHTLFLQRAAISWIMATLLNPHLHHYDLLLVTPALIVALSEWGALTGRDQLLLGGIFVVNHLGFVFIDILGLHATLPLPAFGLLAVWGWFFVRLSGASQLENFPENRLATGGANPVTGKLHLRYLRGILKRWSP